MTRPSARAFLFDLACVAALVVVGTRNHETDTGIADVAGVAAPFVLALLVSRASPVVRRDPTSLGAGAFAWACTVAAGMTLRNLVFDRGTALPFVIVATTFLGLTMLGWRTAANRTRPG